VDHGATGVNAPASARLHEIFDHLAPDNWAELQKRGVNRIEMHVVPYDKKLIELDEFKELKGTKTPDGRLWDNVRGVGGDLKGSTLRFATAEEDLPGSRHGHGAAIGLGIVGGLAGGGLGGYGGAELGIAIGKNFRHGEGPGGIIGGVVGGVVGAGLGAVGGAFLGDYLDKPSGDYGRDFLATHEGTHGVEEFALTPDQRKRVDDLFQNRKKAGGPWLAPADYTGSNVHEYFAQCASAYFSKPYEPEYTSTYKPEWLKLNDPGMFALLDEIFGKRAPGVRNDKLGMEHRTTAAG